jgi:P63C domain
MSKEKTKKITVEIDPSKGGEARALSLTAERRSEIARDAVTKRWAKVKAEKALANDTPKVPRRGTKMTRKPNKLPVAKYLGVLEVLDLQIPCYVLDNGLRVMGRVAVTFMLTQVKGQGDLEGYLSSENWKAFVDLDELIMQMVMFDLPEVEQLKRSVKGLPTGVLIDLCSGLVNALNAHQLGEVTLTKRQLEIARQASRFLAACAKVGLDALVDEATGYQEFREKDALQVKLRAYLEESMRPWEKTFPDELWIEFGRLTNWSGSVTQRPKYWGILVTQLIYQYLDQDVAHWLKENVPEPRKGRNYHQWLSSQYGLKRLVEHIWMVVGVAKTCHTMDELRYKMNQMFGKGVLQRELFYQVPVSRSRPLSILELTKEAVQPAESESESTSEPFIEQESLFSDDTDFSLE